MKTNNKNKDCQVPPLGAEGAFETQAIRTQTERSQHREHATPMFLTSSFVFEDAEDMRASFAEEKEHNLYSRYSNPTVNEFVQKVVQMEGAERGYAFASGMGAVYNTLASVLETGDEIIACQSIFGSTASLFNNFFPKWNINTNYFKIDEIETIEAKITPKTKVIYVESPTNPAVDILDLDFIGKIAKKHQLIFVVDNCFATPYLQNPIKYGANLVIHSGTKLMDGQGRVLAGITVGDEELVEKIYRFSRITGCALSPFNAWVLSKSLETLAVRVDRQCENALKVAEFLENHPNVNLVKYPHLPSHPQYELAKKQMKKGGTIVAFEVKGGVDAGRNFLNNIKLLSLTANLGDSRSIVTHPASTTHSKLSEEDRLLTGITGGLIRVSVGLEHYEDIIADLKQALNSPNN